MESHVPYRLQRETCTLTVSKSLTWAEILFPKYFQKVRNRQLTKFNTNLMSHYSSNLIRSLALHSLFSQTQGATNNNELVPKSNLHFISFFLG